MSRVARFKDLPGQLLGEGEKVRQLRLRPRTGDTATDEPWQDLTPYLAPGWANYGSMPGDDQGEGHWARWRGEGQYFALGGSVINESAGDGATHPFLEFPSSPALNQMIMVFESPDASTVQNDAWWYVYCEISNPIYLLTSKTFYQGSPNGGGVPEGQALNLNGVRYLRSFIAA